MALVFTYNLYLLLHIQPFCGLPLPLFAVVVFSQFRDMETGKGFYDELRKLNIILILPDFFICLCAVPAVCRLVIRTFRRQFFFHLL